MKRVLSIIGAWAQMLFAALFVAFAAFNFARAMMGWHNAGIVVMFTALLGVGIALLVLTVRDYQKLLKREYDEEDITNNLTKR